MSQEFNWRRRGYTEETFRRAWDEAECIADVCRALGVPPIGGYYNIMKSTAERLGLPMKQKLQRQGKWGPPKSLDELLVHGSRITTGSVRKRLLKEGILEHRCVGCKRTKCKNPFTGELVNVPLELDHIDGDLLNNVIGNLRLLCPTCHALTPTYKNKNRKSRASVAQ